MPDPLRILLVDDHELFRELATDALQEQFPDAVLIAVETGEAALEYCTAQHFDILILDIQMPGMSGLELTRTLRSGSAGAMKDVPIVGLSGSGHVSEVETALAAGMNDYLVKPRGFQQLAFCIRKLLGLRDYNLDFLRDFCAGDEAEIQFFLKKFEDNYPREVEKLEQSLQIHDRDTLALAAHGLKPQLEFVGLQSAAQEAAALERLAREGASWEQLEACLENLKTASFRR